MNRLIYKLLYRQSSVGSQVAIAAADSAPRGVTTVIYLLARVSMFRLTESDPFGASESSGRRCTVDRYAHGIAMMPGLAARRLSVQITARATRA